MKITQTHYVDNEDYAAEHLNIAVDGVDLANFNWQQDCPEDNSLSRNFRDCFKIAELMEKAYLAGKNGEDFELSRVEKEYGER